MANQETITFCRNERIGHLQQMLDPDQRYSYGQLPLIPPTATAVA